MKRNGVRSVALGAVLGLITASATYFAIEDEDGSNPFRSRSVATDQQDDTSPYDFGSNGCPTQGPWTKAALTQTQNILSIVERLKDNPDCKGIVTTVQGLSKASDALGKPSENENDGSTLEALPGELSALASVAMKKADPLAAMLLGKKTLQTATMAVDTANQTSTPIIDEKTAVKALWKRAKRGSNVGLEAITQVMTELPAYDSCLMGHPNEGLLLLSAVVKTAAAFAASGEGVGQRLGSAIAGLVNMVRERNFTLRMRQLQTTQFWFSVSCLLEATAKTWCDNQNAGELLDYARNQYLSHQKTGTYGASDPMAGSPLQGYYLIVRELPLIARWIRTVKLGVDPRNPSDATYQGSALDSMNEFWKGIKNMQGKFSEQKLLIQATSDLYTKQNTLLTLLTTLVRYMTAGDADSKASGRFFLMTHRDYEIPFILVGMDTVPRVCNPGLSAANEFIDWNRWMQNGAGGKFQSIFDNPEALLDKIESNMQTLIVEANQAAGVYFRQRLVIDQLDLASKTLTGQFMSVREAFESVKRYLDHLPKRLGDSQSDAVILADAEHTSEKIGRILDAYSELVRVGQDLMGGKELASDPEFSRRAEDASRKLIGVVFDELNVNLLHDVMLTNRLNTIINYDLSKTVRDPVMLSKHLRDILIIAQDQLVEKLVEVHRLDPTNSRLDLRTAQTINGDNMTQLEAVFGDTMYLQLQTYNEIAQGRSASPKRIDELTQERLERDARQKLVDERARNGFGFVDWLKLVWNGGRQGVVKAEMKRLAGQKPDLYYHTGDPSELSSIEDESGSYAMLRAKLCAQTLMFQSRERFLPLCQGAVLKSQFSPDHAKSELDLSYDAYLPRLGYNRVIIQDRTKIRKRICALNDFNMRNLVYFLEDRDRTSDRRNDLIPSPTPKEEPKKTEVAAPTDPKDAARTATGAPVDSPTRNSAPLDRADSTTKKPGLLTGAGHGRD